MRMYERTRNGEQRAGNNWEFPRVFAVCTAIYPRPQFQLCNLIEIGRTRVYKIINNRQSLHEEYRTGGLNPSLDSEFYFENQNTRENRGQYTYGEIEIVRSLSNYNTESFNATFEMRHLYLTNNYNHIPVVLFYTEYMRDLYPQSSILITPVNMPEIYNSNILDMSSNRPGTIRDFLLEHRDDVYIRDPQNTRQDRRELYNYLNFRTNEYSDNYIPRDWHYTRTPSPPLPPTRRDRRRTLTRSMIAAGASLPNSMIGAGAGEYTIPYEEDDDVNTTARTLLNIREAPSQRTPPSTREPASSTSRNVRPLVLQSFTIKAIIDHAIQEQMTCPISLAPIEKSSACVTSCQHVFNRENIEQWLADNSTCPVCRQQTQICESSTP
jgi:hypothetical protein